MGTFRNSCRFVLSMKNIVSLRTLKEHWEKPGRNDSEQQLKAWYQEAKMANWKNPNDIKSQYKNASIVGSNRVVFNICGNKYRLVVKVNYLTEWIYVRFVGTHNEYDKIDVTTILKKNIMDVKLIKTEDEYNEALSRIDELFDVTPESKEFDEAELLIALVELYEQQHYKIESPDPIEAIKFRMEQMEVKRTDMTKYFGTRGRVSEILNRKRELTLVMIKKLHKDFGIPAESLLA